MDETTQIKAQQRERERESSTERYGFTPVKIQEIEEHDEINANAVMECYINDFALVVHTPLALPPDPNSYEEAMPQWDRKEWRAAVDKKLSNFNSRRRVVSS